MTERQVWARKRNWLIRRLMGAKSIFTFENTTFMDNAIRKKDAEYVHLCECAIGDLIEVMKESTYGGD